MLGYHFKFDAEVYVSRSFLIIFLFQEEIIHQILPTCNARFMFIRHYMLVYLFMLHGIAKT